MTEIADRYRNVAATFTSVVGSVPNGAWRHPAPCEGWVARDVVGHMVGWMPALLEAGAGIVLPVGPPVDDDPLAAWTVMSDGIQAVLDDPSNEQVMFSHPQADLARATGGDEMLDADEVHSMLVGIEPLDEMLRFSGQYGPRVPVSDDADEQTKLLAFVGRRP